MDIKLGFRGFLFISLAFLLLALVANRAQAQDNQEKLNELSKQIQSSLRDSKQSQQALMTQLAEAMQDSSKSKEQVRDLELRLTSLSNSLDNTHSLLTNYAEKTSVLENKLKASSSRVFWLGLIFVAFLILKAARIALGIIPQTSPVVNAFAATPAGKIVDIVI